MTAAALVGTASDAVLDFFYSGTAKDVAIGLIGLIVLLVVRTVWAGGWNR